MEILYYSVGIIFLSVLIFYFGGIFSNSSSKIGDYFKLSRSVKGATFDAVAGSMPEFMVALFSVLFFNKFEVGIGTIAGSALFNLLIIPALCVLVSPKIFRVSKTVISRDALFYIISVFILMVCVLYFKVWGVAIASFFILMYILYLIKIFKTSKEDLLKEASRDGVDIIKEFYLFFLMMLFMGVCAYFLTEFSINLANLLGISPVIIGFTIIAAATSVPDTVISVINAKKGNSDDAMSNVFGSNTFDILIGLGIPLLVYTIFFGPVFILFDYLEIVIGLLGATIMLLFFMIQDHKLKKSEAIILLFLYLIFIVYVILL